MLNLLITKMFLTLLKRYNSRGVYNALKLLTVCVKSDYIFRSPETRWHNCSSRRSMVCFHFRSIFSTLLSSGRISQFIFHMHFTIRCYYIFWCRNLIIFFCSMFPRSTHETFAQKLYQTYKAHKRFSKPKLARTAFTINHYAGDVSACVVTDSQYQSILMINTITC